MKSPENFDGRAIITGIELLPSAARTADGAGDVVTLDGGFGSLALQLDVTGGASAGGSIAANADDGYDLDSTLTANGTTLKIGRPTGATGQATTLARFANVAIPPGATILSASLTFVRAVADAGSVPVLIDAIADPDPAFPANSAAYGGLSHTTANVSDTIASGGVPTPYTTPNLAAIVQEVINAGGWASGQAMLFAIAGNSAAEGAVVQLAANEHTTLAPAVLSVTFLVGSIDVYLQTTIDGTNWVDAVHFTTVDTALVRRLAKIVANASQAEFNAATALSSGAVRNLIGPRWRCRWDITDSTGAASFTFKVSANQLC